MGQVWNTAVRGMGVCRGSQSGGHAEGLSLTGVVGGWGGGCVCAAAGSSAWGWGWVGRGGVAPGAGAGPGRVGVELRLEGWGCGRLVAAPAVVAEEAAGGGVECKGVWEEASWGPSEGPSAFIGRLAFCCCCCCWREGHTQRAGGHKHTQVKQTNIQPKGQTQNLTQFKIYRAPCDWYENNLRAISP